jgi:hypothetical protein
MADEEKTVDQLTTDDLFKSAMAEPPAPEPAEPPAPEPPAPVEPPEPAAATVTPPAVPPTPDAIPSWRLKEEAEGRRLAEQRAQALEARLNEIATHIRQQQKQPDFFENPDAATQALVQRVLQPIVEDQRRQTMYLGKMVAEAKHGEDKVGEAEQSFLKAREAGTLDPADYERVVGSPNRYDAVVQWHKRQSVLTSVGDDPQAWFDKQLEARMADPQFQAKLLEKVKGSAATKPSAVKIPPSLSRTTAAASNSGDQLGDMSDRSLFEYAMRR